MTNIEIDTTTGLPTLPDGFRWEVVPRHERSGFYLNLQQRDSWDAFSHGYERHGFLWLKKRKREVTRWRVFEGGLISTGNYYESYDEDLIVKVLTPEAILTTALELYADFSKDRRWVADLEASRQYVGTYPPKSLTNKS